MIDLNHSRNLTSRARACCLIAVLMLVGLLAASTTAQTFTALYSFSATSCYGCPNGDGARPFGVLILSGNTLYGTANIGGSSSAGTVFSLNIDGTGFTPFYSFTAGSDGANPSAGVVLSTNTLYGTAYSDSSGGTVFAVTTDGGSVTTLHTFTGGSDGAGPEAGLILSTNTLYGTTAFGGSSGGGTVFAINTDGSGYTNLYSFTARDPMTGGNNDGANPAYAGVTLSGTTLYGTAYTGGTSGHGTVFAIHTDGTGFKNLHSFTATAGILLTNSDGANPEAGVFLSGNTLYGTANNGGSSGHGTVFAIHTDGTGFATLHSFAGSDGAGPRAGLILSGNTLYGTTQNGGTSNTGMVFAVNIDGTAFSILHEFTGGTDGGSPTAGLILSGNTLYGTALLGGDSGSGTVFSLSLVPRLTITPSASNVILTWPTNATGFTLQSATNLVPLAVWVTISPAPVIVNGQNVVTNPISSTQQFFRLSQ